MPFTELNRSNKQEKKRQKIEGDSKKKEVPKDFIKKIEKLGLNVEDAAVLYASKIDWTAAYSDNKIHCTEMACDFNTKIDSDVLTKHMIECHDYGDYPCDHPHCDWVGFSKSSLNRHKPMHTRHFEKEYWHKCPKPGCKSTFNDLCALDLHCRLHANDLDVCRYCPYRYVKADQYTRHLKLHFGIRDYECDKCDLKFLTKADINRHYQLHEGIIYTCLICKTYYCHSKNNMESHLRVKHTDIVGKNFTWGIVKHHVKIKNNL